jgi:D-alanyl-D-alanine carboxypeptidase/D-alanyl-D-alanine-endopeptidase (penicillin-binding protein 4)
VVLLSGFSIAPPGKIEKFSSRFCCTFRETPTMSPIDRSPFSQIFSLSLGILLALIGKPSPAQASPSLCPADLAPRISAITNRPEFRRVRWGILVQRLGAPATEAALYAQDAERYFIPASNAKLLTTAAALTQLGQDYRIRTSVYQQDTGNGVVLRVVGRGDPSFDSEDLADLAKQIGDRTLSPIQQLIADDHYFRGDPLNPNWEWEDIQSGYGAPVNSLILNENLVGFTLVPQALGQPLKIVWDDPTEADRWQINNRSRTVAADAEEFLQVGRDLGRPVVQVQGHLRVGSASEAVAISITQPDRHFLQLFRQSLKQANVNVLGTAIAPSPATNPGTEIAFVESAPLSELLIATNRSSNNLYAESLLRQLGATQNPNAESSLDAGLEILENTLTRLGVAADSYQLADGSGLSRHNFVSPQALVQTLQGMARSPLADPYRNSLSLAGANGTLRNRFRNTPLEGKLQAKTGFLSGMTGISGYASPPNYSPITFAVLINQFDQPLTEVQGAIDEIVGLLGQLKPCP